MTVAASLLSLFLAAFLAATLLPGGSELLLVALLVQHGVDPWLLIAVATVGNTLGSVVNWACGRFLHEYRGARWFPVKPAPLARFSGLFRRYGIWCLLLAWAPVIGDVVTVLAGMARVPIGRFAILVGLGKLARYLVVAAAVATL